MRIFLRFLITAIILSFTSVLMSHSEECNCVCGSCGGLNVVENFKDLWKMVQPHHNKLMEWEEYKPFVKRFSNRWEEEITRIVDIKMEEFIDKWSSLPKSENQNDVILSKSTEESNPLVYSLLAKVEEVENRTFEVEEELKSERRVRRHLEQEVNETRSSLNNLGIQLQNVTGRVDNMMNQVQLGISSLEDMNKTIYEDHLKKLYYKVKGVVYKKETEKLGERLGQVETELYDSDNSSIVSKLAKDLKAVEENLLALDSSIEDTVKPRLEVLNSSIEDTVKPRLEVLISSIEDTVKPRLEVLISSFEDTVKPRLEDLNSSIEGTIKTRLEVLNSSISHILVPRIETLENKTVRKDVVKELSGKLADILNETELFKTSLTDIRLNIQDIKNFERELKNVSIAWNKSLETLQNQIDFLKNETEEMNKSQREPKIDDNIEIVENKVTGLSDDTEEPDWPGRCYSKDLRHTANVDTDKSPTVTSSGHRFNVVCKEGFSPKHDGTHCLNGNWMQNWDSPCKESDCEVPFLHHGDLSQRNVYGNYQKIPIGTAVKHGTSYMLFCHRGIIPREKVLMGEVNCTRGNWSPDPVCHSRPTCSLEDLFSAVPKDVVPDIDNTNKNFYYDKQLKLTCVDELIVAGFPYATCGLSGKWEFQDIQCISGCKPPSVDSKVIFKPEKNEYKLGDMITYSCPPGMHLYSQSKQITCQKYGWSRLFPPYCT